MGAPQLVGLQSQHLLAYFISILLVWSCYLQVVKVMVDDGEGGIIPYTAAVIGTDAMHDLAVLQASVYDIEFYTHVAEWRPID